ncbi:MAG TPA: AraC family transcriptional regulator, partial [Bacillota bacterium]|nr:AraC family transcriptional regulator [Bacillota bacterium]
FFNTTNLTTCVFNKEMMMPMFKNLNEIYNHSEFSDIMITTYLIQTLVCVVRCFNKSEFKNRIVTGSDANVGRVVYYIIRYIDNNIFDKLEIKTISKAIGYNYSYISNLFRKTTGITLMKYITNKKMEKAIELLHDGKFTITDIARKLSYSDVQTFNKAFKRTLGVSPSKFDQNGIENTLLADEKYKKININN